MTSEAGVAEGVLAGQRARLTQRLKADRTLEDVLADGIAQRVETIHFEPCIRNIISWAEFLGSIFFELRMNFIVETME